MSIYKDNEKLLDKKGKWYSVNRKNINLAENKVVIGFLRDSKHNVIAKMNQWGLTGYACSHFRFLTEDEIVKYCIKEKK